MTENKIDRKNVEEMMGLTSMQEGMLFHYLTNPESLQYFEQIHLTLSGSIERQLFEEAWRLVTCNNEMLRSIIRWEKLEEPIQIVLKQKEIPIRVVEFKDEDQQSKAEGVQKIIKKDRETPININRDPFRVTLCLISENESRMLLSFHHIVLDGWSTGIILQEFLTAYNCLSQGETQSEITKARYKDFFKWYQQSQTHYRDQRREFWKKHLEGFDTLTLLPYNDNKLQDIQQVSTYRLNVPATTKQRLEVLAQEHNVTISTLLYAAWGILLQKYNNSDDVIFGTTVSGRSPEVKGIDRIVGLFINTLPLRIKATKETPLYKLFQILGNHLQEQNAYGNEHSSLTEIKQLSGLSSDSNLFDSIIVIDNYPLDNMINEKYSSNQLEISGYQTFEMTNFDITLQIMMLEAGEMPVDIHYNNELFETETIQRMANHYDIILRGIVSNPAQKIADVPILSEHETRQILEEFNNPSIQWVVDKTIHGVIEDQSVHTPDKKAVQYEDRWVTYHEFNQRANQLAFLLTEKGVQAGTDTRVAMLLPRSIDMIVVLLGILKAGASCIPLDISYPEERNGFIVKDSEASFLLITISETIDPSKFAGITPLVYQPENLKTYPEKNPGRGVSPEDLSYIIYTSGSTGNPKGALLHHSGIVNHTYTKIDVLGITGNDTVANNFSINVIASVWQILSPLFVGARLVVYSDEIEWDPYRQFQQVETDGVTVIEVIPSVLKAFLFVLTEGKEKIPLLGLRKIALTSEETKPVLVNQFYNTYTHIDMVDCYGQTECCDDVLHYTIPHDTNTKKVPIGYPSLNTRVSILNHHDQLQPVGVPGEICVISAGVAYGYWKRPELNDEKFTLSPAAKKALFDNIHQKLPSTPNTHSSSIASKDRFYRTGDLGRWQPDGKVEYLGRIDHQVKIRGNRVELREIENHLLRYPAIKEAAVVDRDDRDMEKNLYAFFTATEEITTTDIRQFLLKTLPDYMVPAHFIPMEQLPLTPNGKIDRKVLRKMEIKGSTAAGSQYTPPRNDIEKQILAIWKQLLNTGDLDNPIGINDNFFDLGGHSLLLIKLKSKLEKNFKLNWEIPIVELFNYPTIARLASFIEEKLNSGGQESGKVQVQMAKKISPAEGHCDIAVIGISLRLPEANNIHEFWQNLIEGKESISFFSEEELEVSEGYQVIEGNSQRIMAGGVLGEIDLFDADFFGYTPREAQIMDPQQRLFLEHAWWVMEDAGYAGETYPGAVGIYAGIGWNTYLLNQVLANTAVIKAMGEFQTMIGNDKDFLATRVSYKLNLKGPSMTVQTACSTSLVAVHLARLGLINGDCDMAMAGGVVVRVPEKTGYFYTEGGHLSPDGHCRPFDANARGTVFSNGIGIVLLKRLEDALTDSDHIYAIIKGSAINNDGSLKVGYTSPSEIQQSKVISNALIDANVESGTIGYIETHGTGTKLGDPVEVAALTRAFQSTAQSGTSSLKKQYCAIGSLKSMLGHLDVAAGIIGFIKTVLVLKNKQIPPSINYESPNPIIDFANSPFYVNSRLKEWSQQNTPRRAGVSSLGIGGTNAHVILEEAPPIAETTGSSSVKANSKEKRLILISAKSESSLDKITQNLVDYLKNEPETNIADMSYTLQTGRERFSHRRMFLCPNDNINETIAILSAREKAKTYSADTDNKPIIFMFPGQGSQYINMGMELYRKEPVFQQELDRCFKIIKPYFSVDIKKILYPNIWEAENDSNETRTQTTGDNRKNSIETSGGGNNSINHTEITQPVLFIFEYALSKLLLNWGIKPYAMVGHSIGEYVAACLSGVLSLENALKLVAIRGAMMQQMPHGAMLSVSISPSELNPLMISYENLSLAAVNSSTLCVVSGPHDEVDRFAQNLEKIGIDYTRLHTSHAFHSAMMDPILTAFGKEVKQVQLNEPGIPYISNVTGDWITGKETASHDYWVTHLRNTVLFDDGLKKLLELESALFLEIGPGKALSTFVRRHADKKNRQMAIELVRHPKKNISDVEYLLDNIGQLWLQGAQIDWQHFYANQKRKRISLPGYPFDKKSYWLQAEEREQTPQIEIETEIGLTKQKLEDWFYMPAWQQAVPPSAHIIGKSLEKNIQKETAGECWLIFLDEFEEAASETNGIGRQVLKQLSKENYVKNIEIITVIMGGRYKKTEGTENIEYVINPGNYDDYESLLNDIQNNDKTINKVVHFWTLYTAVPVDGMEKGVISLLNLVKALGRLYIFNKLEINIISNGLFNIETEDSCYPENAALLGPCNVISQEYPNISCRMIDIKGKGIERHLAAELTSLSQKRNVAYRGNNYWIPTVAQIKPSHPEGYPTILKKNGVYLIIGGLGKIGLTLARYLAQTIQARLILTVEYEFPDRKKWTEKSKITDDFINNKIMAIKELEKLGAEVLVLQADITDEQQMLTAICRIEEKYSTINGIIHAAGLMDGANFKTILDTDRDNCYLHFQPKIQGLTVLKNVLREKEYDFCLLNSSISSLLGGLTLYAYSAANSFMDAFARQQNLEYQKNWFVINWDEWKKDIQQTKKLEHPALGGSLSGLTVSPEEGQEVFSRVLSLTHIPQIIISTGNLHHRLQQWVTSEKKPDTKNKTKEKKNQLAVRPKLQSLYVEPKTEAEKITAEIWQELLGVDSIGINDDFFELGGHSLLATKLVARMREIYRIDLPLDILFDKPTIRELLDYIVQAWGDGNTVEEIANIYREVQLS